MRWEYAKGRSKDAEGVKDVARRFSLVKLAGRAGVAQWTLAADRRCVFRFHAGRAGQGREEAGAGGSRRVGKKGGGEKRRAVTRTRQGRGRGGEGAWVSLGAWVSFGAEPVETVYDSDKMQGFILATTTHGGINEKKHTKETRHRLHNT